MPELEQLLLCYSEVWCGADQERGARELYWHSLKRYPFARNGVKDPQDFGLPYAGHADSPVLP